MLKVLRYICSSSLISSIGVITKNFEYSSITVLFIGLAFLVMGLEEFQKKRTTNGWLHILLSLFSFYVSIQGFY
ncbi:YczI family protein [Bacillus sp. OV322]|uniref:YczI family protein n=1 Tax=Bacillus sp. OV322 TaxID=1882764 RepID=UPI000B8479F2